MYSVSAFEKGEWYWIRIEFIHVWIDFSFLPPLSLSVICSRLNLLSKDGWKPSQPITFHIFSLITTAEGGRKSSGTKVISDFFSVHNFFTIIPCFILLFISRIGKFSSSLRFIIFSFFYEFPFCWFLLLLLLFLFYYSLLFASWYISMIKPYLGKISLNHHSHFFYHSSSFLRLQKP